MLHVSSSPSLRQLALTAYRPYIATKSFCSGRWPFLNGQLLILSTKDRGGEIAVSIVCGATFHEFTRDPHIVGIRILNLWLILPLLTASINGLDSSLVNGEQHCPTSVVKNKR